MITEPLTFTGTLSLQDWLDLNCYHFRCVFRWPIRVLLAVFSLFIASLVIFLGKKIGFTAFSFFILALCVYFPFGWLLHRRLAATWRYQRQRDQFIEHTVIITNDDVMVSSVHTDVRLNWDRLSFIVSTPHGPFGAWPDKAQSGTDSKKAET